MTFLSPQTSTLSLSHTHTQKCNSEQKTSVNFDISERDTLPTVWTCLFQFVLNTTG